MFKDLFKGAVWIVGLTWLSRLIGLFSVIIVARILMPEDYGIVAISMIVMHFILYLSSAGTVEYLVGKKDLSISDVNTSWTLLIISRSIYCAILFFGSEFFASYFNEPRLSLVFKFIAFIALLDAAKNMNLFLEEKKINYKPIFFLGLSRKLVVFFVSVTLAMNQFTYWSLIYAELIGSIFFVVCTYIFLPVEKRHFIPSMSRLGNQIGFYSWSFLQVFIGFTKSKLDGLLMAKYVGSTGMGEYHLSSSLADMPSNELATPITRPLYAGLAQHDANSYNQINLAYKALAAVSLTVFFLSFFVATSAEEIVAILLGEKWKNIPIVVSILCASYALYASGTLLQRLLTVQGKIKHVFYMDCISFLMIFAIIGYSAIFFKTLLAISYGRFISSLFVLLLSVFYTSRLTALRFRIALKGILPSFLIGISACFFSVYASSFFEFGVIINLIAKSVFYCLYFVMAMYLWTLFNRYENYESFFIRNVWGFISLKMSQVIK